MDESYYNLIPLIFRKIRHNFGIVGGRKNRAYYFIGIQEDNKLIFSDPHLNQEMTGNIWKDNEKYYNENLYLMDIKEMSSGFSFLFILINIKYNIYIIYLLFIFKIKFCFKYRILFNTIIKKIFNRINIIQRYTVI